MISLFSLTTISATRDRWTPCPTMVSRLNGVGEIGVSGSSWLLLDTSILGESGLLGQGCLSLWRSIQWTFIRWELIQWRSIQWKSVPMGANVSRIDARKRLGDMNRCLMALGSMLFAASGFGNLMGTMGIGHGQTANLQDTNTQAVGHCSAGAGVNLDPNAVDDFDVVDALITDNFIPNDTKSGRYRTEPIPI